MLKLNTPQIKVVMEKADGFEKHILQEAIKSLLQDYHSNEVLSQRAFMIQFLIDNHVLIEDNQYPVGEIYNKGEAPWEKEEGTKEIIAKEGYRPVYTWEEDITNIRMFDSPLSKEEYSALQQSLTNASRQIEELGLADGHIRITTTPNFLFNERLMEFVPLETEVLPDNHVKVFTTTSQSITKLLELVLNEPVKEGPCDTSKVVIVVNHITNGIFSKDGYVRYAYVSDHDAFYKTVGTTGTLTTVN